MSHTLLKLLLLSMVLIIGSSLYAQSSVITTKSGETFKCKITSEDSTSIYFTTKMNGRYVNSFIVKEEVEEIKTINKEQKDHTTTNLGIGYGPSYGILGMHAIIGKNNSGLLLGLGITPNGNPAPAIGAQASFKWFFMNVGYGVLHEVSTENKPFETQLGPFMNFGGMISLGKTKRSYIEIGLGLSLSDPDYSIYSSAETFSYKGSLGYGYRF